MKAISKFDQILICRQPVDFRCGIFSLTALIQNELELDPFENYLFIFINNARNRIRLIYWDKTGFAMWYKVLERGRFFWPLDLEGDSIIIDRKILRSLLDGLNPWQQGHQELHYKFV